MSEINKIRFPYEMTIRGVWYYLTPEGYIVNQSNVDSIYGVPGPHWQVYGVAHRWNAHPVLWHVVKHIVDEEGKIEGYLFDIDHGTKRMHSGQYAGKIPKVKIIRR